MTTLDRLIETYGRPSFIKIDVEGHEPQVLRGLSSKVPGLSFEFVPTLLSRAVECVDYLAAMGDIRLNLTQEESFTFVLPEWVGPAEAKSVMESYARIGYFDVFVRFSAAAL